MTIAYAVHTTASASMKLKSGIAPVCDLREAGVRLGIGCDNCSGSDVQSVFQAMKMFCLLGAVSEPEPGPAMRHPAEWFPVPSQNTARCIWR